MDTFELVLAGAILFVGLAVVAWLSSHRQGLELVQAWQLGTERDALLVRRGSHVSLRISHEELCRLAQECEDTQVSG